MINRFCPLCLGVGWVCENHPDRVWDDDLGCQCGAGMPCDCQRQDEILAGIEEPDISKVLKGGDMKVDRQ